MPGVWVYPNSTKLQFRVGREVLHLDGVIETPPLPIKDETTVTLEVVGDEAIVLFDGNLVGYYQLVGERESGDSTLFASSPWFPAALAKVKDVRIRPSNILNYKFKKPSPIVLAKNSTGYKDISSLGEVTRDLFNCGSSDDLIQFHDGELSPMDDSGEFSILFKGKMSPKATLYEGTIVSLEFQFPSNKKYVYYNYDMCDYLDADCPASAKSTALQTFRITEDNEGLKKLIGEWGRKMNFRMSATTKSGLRVFCMTGNFDYEPQSSLAKRSEIFEYSQLEKRQYTRTGTSAFGTGYRSGSCASPACRG